ncbi:hypothetical protein GWI33_014268 [Rhynchophorus ferrugineus]|uniref:Uncharacterized protein n=1 Tax=Rhynchophorus ferrugineus TaxID=354439 RepID=A0A834I4U2_RHYFE|nr:hypothetical protein GWI33_014268 [Rhynchophorus ferrugineus]
MTAVHRVVAASGMDVKHDMVYHPEAAAQVSADDDVLLIKAEPVPGTHPGTVVMQQNGLVSVATSAGTTLLQPANGALSNGPFSGLGAGSGSPAASKPRRPTATDDWLSSPSPSGGASSLTPSPGPPSHAFTVISNGYPSPLSSGSYDPYSPNGKLDVRITFLSSETMK